MEEEQFVNDFLVGMLSYILPRVVIIFLFTSSME